MVKQWLDKLTDQYSKRQDSNIGKLFTILDSEVEKVKQSLLKIEDWKDLNKAEGSTLDLRGQNIGQARGQASDAIFRILIRSKEAQAQSDGTHNSILKILSIALQVDPSEIEMTTLREQGTDEPAALIITKAPYNALNSVGMTPAQFVQLAQNSALAGVRVASANFEGTFSFASGDAIEEDSTAGFSNLEGTTGGYFGATVSPEDGAELPV